VENTHYQELKVIALQIRLKIDFRKVFCDDYFQIQGKIDLLDYTNFQHTVFRRLEPTFRQVYNGRHQYVRCQDQNGWVRRRKFAQ